jgi:signal peptidase II
MKRNPFYFVFILLLILADQVTKSLVARSLPLYRSHRIIPGFFNLTRIHNRGAIFGFFSQDGRPFVHLILAAASLSALILVIYYFFKTPPSDRLMKLALSLILAGALGNLIDRIFRGHVIDFLDFYIGRHHWPFFNVADSCISIGACLLILVFFRRKPA